MRTPCLLPQHSVPDARGKIQPLTSIEDQIRDAMRQAWAEGYASAERNAVTRRQVDKMLANFPEEQRPDTGPHNPYES